MEDNSETMERLSLNDNIQQHRNEYSNCEAIFDVYNTRTEKTVQVEIRRTQKYEYTMEECEIMGMGINVRPLVNTKFTSIFTGLKHKQNHHKSNQKTRRFNRIHNPNFYKIDLSIEQFNKFTLEFIEYWRSDGTKLSLDADFPFQLFEINSMLEFQYDLDLSEKQKNSLNCFLYYLMWYYEWFFTLEENSCDQDLIWELFVNEFQLIKTSQNDINIESDNNPNSSPDSSDSEDSKPENLNPENSNPENSHPKDLHPEQLNLDPTNLTSSKMSTRRSTRNSTAASTKSSENAGSSSSSRRTSSRLSPVKKWSENKTRQSSDSSSEPESIHSISSTEPDPPKFTKSYFENQGKLPPSTTEKKIIVDSNRTEEIKNSKNTAASTNDSIGASKSVKTSHYVETVPDPSVNVQKMSTRLKNKREATISISSDTTELSDQENSKPMETITVKKAVNRSDVRDKFDSEAEEFSTTSRKVINAKKKLNQPVNTENEAETPLEATCPDTEQDERMKSRRHFEKTERKKKTDKPEASNRMLGKTADKVLSESMIENSGLSPQKNPVDVDLENTKRCVNQISNSGDNLVDNKSDTTDNKSKSNNTSHETPRTTKLLDIDDLQKGDLHNVFSLSEK